MLRVFLFFRAQNDEHGAAYDRQETHDGPRAQLLALKNKSEESRKQRVSRRDRERARHAEGPRAQHERDVAHGVARKNTEREPSRAARGHAGQNVDGALRAAAHKGDPAQKKRE